ncbi:helix-turn-helix domain-containing protein [Paucidesulfovibrio longus]|uniref:helix-turn-helix domain-containing protein n=1 Tax=Paucidesulfovibrio longus TaxID=889 RepID=UPI0003B3CDB4|nr:helix-turn-helix domain-containing protein [Paucidesulfovibrio longus]
MPDKTLTHKDLGDALGVSVTTVKSYRRKFPGYIPVAGYGKPIRFQPKALEVCKKIRECFEQGLSVAETEKRLKQAGFRSEGGRRETAPEGQSVSAMAGASPEYLEKFFKTAGQMMQGMAQLATAQARSEQRLSRLEEALRGLLEAEAGNQVLLGELAAGFRTDRQSGDASSGQLPGGEASAPQDRTAEDRTMETDGLAAQERGDAEADSAGEDGETPSPQEEQGTPERRVRAKKIVNVRGRDGVDSYALEKGGQPDASRPAEPETDQPGAEFLAMPVAIRSERGDFLGLPGRLSLGDFTSFLVRQERESGPVLSTWSGVGDTWTLSLRSSTAKRRELGFSKHTTNRGVDLAVLLHLNQGGVVADREELMEFFREMKDLIHMIGEN